MMPSADSDLEFGESLHKSAHGMARHSNHGHISLSEVYSSNCTNLRSP